LKCAKLNANMFCMLCRHVRGSRGWAPFVLNFSTRERERERRVSL